MISKILILQGSPRPHGNTVTLLAPMVDELRLQGAEVETITLYGKDITPCDACWTCQDVLYGYGCPKDDDMQAIAAAVLACDVLVLATPIYTWYCTPPMKAVLDRFYGMNKYYGQVPGPRLWSGMKMAIVATCGYEIDYGTSPFETGIQRLCEHSQLEYIGMLAERDLDDQASFRTPEAIAAARAFAMKLLDSCDDKPKANTAPALADDTPNRGIPLLEYDADEDAVILASRLLAPIDVPEHCVITFFKEVVDQLLAEGKLRLIHDLRSEGGKHPVYEMDWKGRRITVCHSMVGGPFAAGMMEETAALGCKKYIVCGGAGVLRKDIAVGHLVVPDWAVRDEGASYHYLPPSREVAIDPAIVASICQVLEANGVPYLTGKTWTTDAFYRETKAKVARRRSEGCVTVEMECASFAAVARFRGLSFGQILYGGDDLSGPEWDSRRWQNRSEIRRGVFELAVEACLNI